MDKLQTSYESKRFFAQKFAERLKEQVEELLSKQRVSLAVPIEMRVKEWDSIKSKAKRKNLELHEITELEDFIGARIILLFKRDVQRVCDLIGSTFRVISVEDTQQRLGVSQFGYQSMHFQIALPEDWLRIPTFKDFSGFSVEVQVRTAAQHIWAAASHVLQYKHEQAVPQSVLRSINRVSALLETVDLEFERALQERQEYRDELDITDENTPLNVESLKALMDSIFPKFAATGGDNKSQQDSYDSMLEALKGRKIMTLGQLRELIKKWSPKVLAWDQDMTKKLTTLGHLEGDGFVSAKIDKMIFKGDKSRLDRGVYCSHAGLIYQMLEQSAKSK